MRRQSLRNFLEGNRKCRILKRPFSQKLTGASPPTQGLQNNKFLQIYEPVQQALYENRPVVALESTIVSHGMPFPENLSLSRTVAEILRNKGVEPATIAVKDGVCRIGLSPIELEDLAQAKLEDRVEKVSTRELSLLLARQKSREGTYWGATTVASTMTLAHLAGIKTFVTGGIGGVHRGGEDSMDVSADLRALASVPTVVVSAGIKSILDIQRTLEVLETNGVPVISYQADEFPAFFSSNSGVPSPARCDSANEIANAFWAARKLRLSHGLLVGVPNFDPAGATVENAIQQALDEAATKKVSGQAVTPYILKRVAELTDGDSLRSNIALVKNNASIGADIAIAISNKEQFQSSGALSSLGVGTGIAPPQVVVVGGIIRDLVAKPRKGEIFVPNTSNPAKCNESDGGVGRNVAEVLGRLGSSPLLYSAVGEDIHGDAILQRISSCGVRFDSTTIVRAKDYHTALYVALLDGDGDLSVACASTDILAKIKTPSLAVIQESEIIIVDGNPSLSVLKEIVRVASLSRTKVFFEPTSNHKARLAAADSEIMSGLTCAFPNTSELFAMAEQAVPDQSETSLEETKKVAAMVLKMMRPDGAQLVVTMGERGVLLATKDMTGTVCFKHFEVERLRLENATGAGDSLCGGVVHALLQKKSLEEAIHVGIAAANLSLGCEKHAVSPEISNMQIAERPSD